MYTKPFLDGEMRINADSSIYRYKRGLTTNPYYPNFDFINISESERKSACEQIFGAMRDYLSSTMNLEHKDHDVASSYGYMWGTVPGELKAPPPRYSEVNVKEGIPHENFEARVRAGEILMSNYERSVIRVKQYPGICSKSAQSLSFAVMPCQVLVDAGFFTLQEAQVFGKKVLFFGNYVFNVEPHSALLVYSRESVTEPPKWVYPPLLGAEDVFSACKHYNADATSLVTNTAAKINRSSVDVLTAFAELPKSIRSVIRGAKLVARMLKDVKKRQFSLSTAYARRERRMNKSFNDRLERLDRELRNPKLSKSRRIALQSHRDKVFVTHRETMLKTADELASATANVWMNYRYNIMTNVYLAQDIYDATEKLGRQFVTASGTVRNDHSLPYGNGYIDMSTTLRCVIKRSFTAEQAARGESVLSHDILTTAWELVPLSYVADWFVNFGDNIMARTYSIQYAQQGATLARKYTLNATIVDPQFENCSVEPRSEISGFYYRRDLIIPQQYCGLVWQPSLGLERKLDAAALGWRAVRSLFLKGKNR